MHISHTRPTDLQPVWEDVTSVIRDKQAWRSRS